MYEVVKVVNGYAITRMIGSKGCYHVCIEQGNGFKKLLTFRTIKAAAEYIITTLEPIR